MRREWSVAGSLKDQDLLTLTAKSRGVTRGALVTFLGGRSTLRNPLTLPGVSEGASVLREVIKAGKRVVVCGDYDADGVTSTAAMYAGLAEAGADVDWLVPSRVVDGYGLNRRLVDECVARGAGALVTVDNGIAAHDAVDYAVARGLTVVVTDHHPVVGGLPRAHAVVDPFVDPAYPFKGVCGCMVAYKLLRVLVPDLHERAVHPRLVALATIGTVADVMPLVDENRAFVYHGLKDFYKSGSFGLNHLLKQLRLNPRRLTAQDIGFQVGPCLNAAGRMDDAGKCVRLFLGDDDSVEDLARELVELNEYRKEVQREVMENVVVAEDTGVIVQEVPQAPPGLLGIIAGKLAERYARPCLAVKLTKGGYYGGSGRSLGGFDLVAAVNATGLGEAAGHASACGVRVAGNRLGAFRKRLNEAYDSWLIDCNGVDLGQLAPRPLPVVAELPLDALTEEFVAQVQDLGPFGAGNPEPVFCTFNASVEEFRVIGKLNNTVKMRVSTLEGEAEAIGFNAVKDKYVDELGAPAAVDLAFKVGVNEWNGSRSLQLVLEDVRPSL